MWVAGIGRNGGKLGLIFQDHGGVCGFNVIQDLRGELPFRREASRRASIQFNQHSVVPTEDYLAAVGSPGLSASGQRCYEFQTTTGPVVIPGQLLVVALVGATTLMRAPLLSPQGPTALVTAMRDAETGEIEFHSTPRRMRQFQTDRWSAVCRMNWVLQFPSAARAWSSVYARALEGQLDIALPNAAATAILRGVEVDGRLMVTGMDMLTLQATEAPLEFAEGCALHGQVLSLIEGTDEPSEKRVELDVAEMTESQLQDLGNKSPVLKKMLAYPVRTHDVKDKIHLIRVHFQTGLPIFLLAVNAAALRSTRAWIKRLQEMGQWPEVADAIKSTL